MAVDFVKRQHDKPWSLVLRAQGGAPRRGAGGRRHVFSDGRLRAGRAPQDLYKGCVFPQQARTCLPPEEVVKQKPAWAEAFELREATGVARAARRHPLRRAGGDPPARGDDGRGGRRRRRCSSRRSRRPGELDNTFILFLGDNGYFFGEHGLGPERRFAYEEGIRSPFLVRYPRARQGRHARRRSRARARTSRPRCSSSRAASRARRSRAARSCRSSRASARGWRKSFLVEYWAENAMPVAGRHDATRRCAPSATSSSTG